MNLESQVCSLELSKRLKELGVKQESLFWHCVNVGSGNVVLLHAIGTNGEASGETCSAFTASELGEMLCSYNIVTSKYKKGSKYIWEVYVQDVAMRINKTYEPSHIADTETDARAKMLIHLIENKLMEIPR